MFSGCVYGGRCVLLLFVFLFLLSITFSVAILLPTHDILLCGTRTASIVMMSAALSSRPIVRVLVEGFQP